MRAHPWCFALATCTLVLAGGGAAHAQAKVVLRLATSAPDGTTWARELRAFAREVESETDGAVAVKWYWGGIAGDEVQLDQRIRRGQLDGGASGGNLCQAASPSMRVIGVRGLFNTREEAGYVLHRLKPTLEQEFLQAGYVFVGAAGLGPDMLFTREPVHDLEGLRKRKVFQWNIDTRGQLMSKDLGLTSVPLPLEELRAAAEDGRIDAFITNPASALAFQWLSLARYVLVMPFGYSWGCLVISQRAFERIPLEHQQTIRSAGAKTGVRLDEVGRQMDDAMLGGVMQKQGIKIEVAGEAARREFLAAARAVRDHLGDQLVPIAALQQVLALLADYRSEHRQP
jgi:TRAP-type C4-dicarboxylate transport system substrate-binding protein